MSAYHAPGVRGIAAACGELTSDEMERAGASSGAIAGSGAGSGRSMSSASISFAALSSCSGPPTRAGGAGANSSGAASSSDSDVAACFRAAAAESTARSRASPAGSRVDAGAGAEVAGTARSDSVTTGGFASLPYCDCTISTAIRTLAASEAGSHQRAAREATAFCAFARIRASVVSGGPSARSCNRRCQGSRGKGGSLSFSMSSVRRLVAERLLEPCDGVTQPALRGFRVHVRRLADLRDR